MGYSDVKMCVFSICDNFRENQVFINYIQIIKA